MEHTLIKVLNLQGWHLLKIYLKKVEIGFRPAGFLRKKHQMLDNLLKPMRRLNIDSNEFAAAKAIFFLNPGKLD